MKKQLLTGAFVLASIFAAQAQVSYSFEASEGYTLGDFVTNTETGESQNGWGASTPFVEVTDTDASAGDNSLLLSSSNEPQTQSIGVFGPDFTNVAGDVVFSVDMKFSAFQTDASTFMIAAQAPSQEKATSRVQVFPDGRLAYFDIDEEDPTLLAGFYFGTYVEETDTFTPFVLEANTWYNIRVEHLFSEETPVIGYIIDGVVYGAAGVWGATAVENVIFLTNNSNSAALIDNIIVDGSETAGVKDNTLANLSVFPNPANNVVNVTVDALVSNITLTDLNGRTVKTVKFDGVSEAQVNISDLASGLYMMTVSSDKGTSTKKIVKN